MRAMRRVQAVVLTIAMLSTIAHAQPTDAPVPVGVPADEPAQPIEAPVEAPAPSLRPADVIDADASTTARADPTAPMWFPQPPRRLHRNTLAAVGEVLAVNGVFWLVAFSIGKPYARISLDSVKSNLQSNWVWDEDAFATNQFGHPYLGALMYNGARSNGFGMFGSSLFSFAGSAFWELFMETETPSINDQFFTPFGGILLGEVLHRFGRAILWHGDPRPRGGRLVVSTIIDPIGMFTRTAIGEAWAHPQPPAMFGYVAAGWNGLSADFGTDQGTVVENSAGRIHASIALSYGLPINDSFRPTRPMDHFDFVVEGDLSRDEASFSLHTRGLLWGRSFGLGPAHAVGGLFGGYDFANPKNIRVGAASLGIGATVHLPLGGRNFFQGTGVASLIPFGAAGGNVDESKDPRETERDYHRGWGSSQLVIGKLARRGLGMVYASNRNFEIDGTYFDEGSEIVSFTRVGGMVSVWERHGLNVEGVFSVRRGNFADKTRDVLDSSAQLRISYVLMQDLAFGGGAAP